MKKIILLLATINVCVFIVSYVACKKKTSDPCASVTCQNGGTCSGGTCNCPTGYTGANCETCTIPCTAVCKNGGNCDCGVCSCPKGYEGSDCSAAWTDKVIGTWAQSDTCALTSTGSPSSTTVTSIDKSQFTVGNIDNTGVSIKCRMTSSTTFKVDSLVDLTNYSIWWGRSTKTGTYVKSKSGATKLSFYVCVKYYTQATPDTCNVVLFR